MMFTPYRLGDLSLSNRLVMAAMTRSRAIDGNVPGPSTVTYYAQRASAGLIITEGSQVSRQGVGYIKTPGIHASDQIAAWARVTEAVHVRGGRIVLQLWHVGRASHPVFHDGGLPVGPSAIAPEGNVFTPSGFAPIPTPRALDLAEMPGIVEQFRVGAENAKAAGFDGVEIHGGNGYLLDQFLRDGSNKRDDAYGGSIANRARLPLEITEAVLGVWGEGRVGYKVTPWSTMLSAFDSDPVGIFSYLAEGLSALRIAYLDVVERPGSMSEGYGPIAPILRKKFRGALILGGGLDKLAGELALAEGRADLVAFGIPFLANPDLVERFRGNAPLNQPDQNTLYQGGDEGYIDYPALTEPAGALEPGLGRL